jgi:hypothetical protein
LRHTAQRRERLVFVLDHEAAHAVLDDFRDRAAAERDDRRAAGHRLDHHPTEGFGPVDREDQRGSIAQERRFVFVAQLANELDAVAVHQRLDAFAEILVAVARHLGGDAQRQAAAAASRMAASGPFSGAMRPRKARYLALWCPAVQVSGG